MAQQASAIDMIKEAQKTGKITIGLESTLKSLKDGNLEYAFVSSNAPSTIINDISHNAEISGTKYSQVAVKSDELGVACKKQFNVTVVGVLKK